MRLTVYLAGPIHGCSDAKANGWRDAVIRRLVHNPVDFRNPMVRDYRGKNPLPAEVIDGDLADIAASDVVLVYANEPSWGTAMEIPYAKQMGKLIYIVRDEFRARHPWLDYHASEYFTDLDQACMQLQRLASGLQQR